MAQPCLGKNPPKWERKLEKKTRKQAVPEAEPTAKGMEILVALARCGNAAQVAREKNSNEGHVRRLRRLHPRTYADLCRQRDEELREEARAHEDAARAAQTKIDAWVDEGFDVMAKRIDALITDDVPRASLDAIKLKRSMRSPAPVIQASRPDEERLRLMADVFEDLEQDPADIGGVND